MLCKKIQARNQSFSAFQGKARDANVFFIQKMLKKGCPDEAS